MALSTWAALAALAGAATALPVAQADELKPIMVVSGPSYDELLSDLTFIGEITNQPALGAMAEGLVAGATQNRGLDGLDKKRPWGVLVANDGEEAGFVGYLPVVDSKKLFAVVAQFTGQPEDLGEGVSRITVAGQTVYTKEVNGWLYVAQFDSFLSDVPANPLKLIDGLDTSYDFAIRADLQNLPDEWRERIVDSLKQGIEGALAQQADDADAGAFDLQKKAAELRMQQFITMLDELDRLTIGWTIDSKDRSTFLDILATVLPDSTLAKQMANTKVVASTLSGFMTKNIPLMVHATQAVVDPTLVAGNIEQAEEMISQMREQAMVEIDKSDEFEEEDDKPVIKDVVNDLLDVLLATMKEGRSDLGFNVEGEGPFTIVGGMYVADGKKVEEAVKRFVEVAESDEEFPEVTLDVDEHNGVTFHSMALPEFEDEDDAEKAALMLGEDADITLGFGPKHVYVAVGEDGVEALSEGIDKSKENPREPEFPFELAVYLLPILQYAATLDDAPPGVEDAADSLERTGKDRIRLTSEVIPNGTKMRFEAEEGVLTLIGVGMQMRAQGGL